MDRIKIIGQRLIELREIKNMEKDQMAAALEVAYSTYVNWENANREPSTEALIKLARYHKVSLDYLVGNEQNYEADEGTGILTEVIKDIKELWMQRSRSVKVNEDTYRAIVKDVGPDPNRISSRLHRIVSAHYQSIEEERQLKLRNAEKAEALAPYYDYLARYFEATKQNGSIEIGITNARVGYESNQDIYQLVDYEIAMEYQYVKLVLMRREEEWPIRFENIKDIKFMDCASSNKTKGRMKAWIYMEKETWRMYMNFHKENVR